MYSLLEGPAGRFEGEAHALDLSLAPAEADFGHASVAIPTARETEIDDGVIKEARRRQRRRWLLGLSITVIAVLTAGLVGSPRAPHQAHREGMAGKAAVAPSTGPTTMLAQEPDLGVACSIPNSIQCDRVGLAVWLLRPALSVTATIAGTSIELNDPTWSGPAIHGRRTMFAGFLQPAGMLNGPLKVHTDRGRYWWAGARPTSARVRILANYGGGRSASASVTVLLAAGWG